jgi:TonB family protein
VSVDRTGGKTPFPGTKKSPAETLVWPPLQSDIDAIEVIDLGAPDFAPPREPASAVIVRRVREPVDCVPFVHEHELLPPPPVHVPVRRYVRLSLVFASLALVELVTFIKHPDDPGGTRAVAATHAVAPAVTAPLTHTVVEAAERSPAATPVESQPGRPVPRAEAEPDPRPAPRARGPLPPHDRPRASIQPSTRGVPGTRRETLRSAPDGPPTAEGTTAENTPAPVLDAPGIQTPAYVPPQSLTELRPKRIPTPFPAPRGSRTRLELVIDERGAVTSARVTASGAEYYDQALLASARSWRFKPALRDGHPTRAVYNVDVEIP